MEAFDAGGQLFAQVTADNRVVVWDVTTGQVKLEHADPQHLKQPIASFAWGALAAGAPAPKRKRGAAKDAPATPAATASVDSGIIGLGMRSGSIVLLSVSRGSVVRTLEGGHSAAVTCLCFNAAGTMAFSADTEGQCVEWDLVSGTQRSAWTADKTSVGALALSPDESTVYTASATITAWRVDTKQAVRTFAGHTTPVRQIVLEPRGRAFASMAANDRFVNVWSVSSDKPLAVLALDSNVSSIHVHEATLSDEAAVRVLAVAAEGAVGVWSVPLTAKGKSKPAAPHCTIQFTSASAESSKRGSKAAKVATPQRGRPIPVIRANFVSVPEGIMIARGRHVHPVFEHVVYMKEDSLELQPLIQLTRTLDRDLLVDSSAVADGSGTRQQGGAPQVTVLDASSMVPQAPKAAARAAAALAEEPSLEERIKELAMGERAVGRDGAAADKHGAGAVAPPKAGSLVVLLSQAVQTNDYVLLEQCLATTDPGVISSTIRRLPTQHVVPFLTQLIHRFQLKPSRGAALAVWIRAVLTLHTAYLMTVPDLVNQLGGLYQTVESRIVVFKRLLRLSGRLDLITAQIANRTAPQDADDALPVAVYAESDDEVSEEDMMEADDDDDGDSAVDSEEDEDVVDDTLRNAEDREEDDDDMEEDDF